VQFFFASQCICKYHEHNYDQGCLVSPQEPEMDEEWDCQSIRWLNPPLPDLLLPMCSCCVNHVGLVNWDCCSSLPADWSLHVINGRFHVKLDNNLWCHVNALFKLCNLAAELSLGRQYSIRSVLKPVLKPVGPQWMSSCQCHLPRTMSSQLQLLPVQTVCCRCLEVCVVVLMAMLSSQTSSLKNLLFGDVIKDDITVHVIVCHYEQVSRFCVLSHELILCIPLSIQIICCYSVWMLLSTWEDSALCSLSESSICSSITERHACMSE